MTGRPSGGYDVSLAPEAASVARARRCAHEAASRWHLGGGATEDLVLVTSELVTNAVLHAQTAIEVRMHRLGSGIRVEVRDGNGRAPVVEVRRVETGLASRSMTGRGLAVVASLSDRWGAQTVPEGGKVVWAEVPTRRRRAVPVSAGIASAPEASAMSRTRRPSRGGVAPAPGKPLTSTRATERRSSVERAAPRSRTGATVRFIDVPLRILMESERQYADLHREMVVVVMNPDGDGSAAVPPTVAREMSATLQWFRWMGATEARAAMDRGDEVVSFDVVVPDDRAREIEQPTGALRILNRWMRKDQLLTLPPSPQVAAYRRWCKAEMAAQLRGRPPSPYPH